MRLMTDADIRQQVERTDRFIAELRKLIAATTTNSASPCADHHRRGLLRIAETLDAVDYVTFANLANVNRAMRGGLLELLEVQLMCVGAGPTLDYPNATAFLAELHRPLIDIVRKRRQH